MKKISDELLLPNSFLRNNSLKNGKLDKKVMPETAHSKSVGVAARVDNHHTEVRILDSEDACGFPRNHKTKTAQETIKLIMDRIKRLPIRVLRRFDVIYLIGWHENDFKPIITSKNVE